ncbi:MAG: hypothetical protein ABIR59_09315 [Gemmatimonadales bacterium]
MHSLLSVQLLNVHLFFGSDALADVERRAPHLAMATAGRTNLLKRDWGRGFSPSVCRAAA